MASSFDRFALVIRRAISDNSYLMWNYNKNPKAVTFVECDTM